jgi:predicted metal-dependent peptidase
MRLTTAERVLKNIVRLQREKPFLSYIVMNFKMNAMKPEAKLEPPTAAVNKYGDFFWGEAWFKELTDDEMQGVLCHEALHIAKGDFFRQGKRDLIIWNIASDCIINWYLVKEGITLPKKVMIKGKPIEGYIPDGQGRIKVGKKTYSVKDKTTEQLYDELIADAEVIKISIGDGKGHGGFDVHLPGDEQDNGESSGKEQGTHTIKAQEGLWKRITVQAATVAKQRGTLPGCAEEFVDDILNPKIDWRNRIKQFVTDEVPVDFCNRLPGRKFYGTGIWCPRIKRENIELMISIDCSGSTEPHRIEFISEAVGILCCYPQVKGRIICWDTEVNENNDIEVDTATAVEKVKGMKLRDISGGTELSSYKRYCEKKGYRSRLHVILTDGFIEDKPQVPDGRILFVLTPDGDDKIIGKYGEVCRLSDKDPNYGE